MVTTPSNHIAVIGAGIVGVSCALWLQKKGLRVTLIDGNTPGSITSSGNACTIADHACIPVNSPDLIKQLPKLMFSNNSPLSVNPIYALTHLPWMLCFLKHCQKDKVQHSIDQLGRLLKLTGDGLDPLIKSTQTEDLLVQNGCIYVYQSEQAFENARLANQARAVQGCELRQLNKEELYELEPNLNTGFVKGTYFENSRSLLNPQQLVTRFFNRFVGDGGKLHAKHAKSVKQSSNSIDVLFEDSQTLSFDRIVIASGAFSKQIIGSGIEKLPLGCERGYHVQYAGEQDLISRPIAWTECGFYASPMNQGLRFAGTVEIAGLSKKKNQRNIDYLTRKSREMFNLREQPTSNWLGYRPTLPDALPVIGASLQSKNIFYAFGHQHIGLTLAGITGKIISELVSDNFTDIDISAFSANRF